MAESEKRRKRVGGRFVPVESVCDLTRESHASVSDRNTDFLADQQGVRVNIGIGPQE